MKAEETQDLYLLYDKTPPPRTEVVESELEKAQEDLRWVQWEADISKLDSELNEGAVNYQKKLLIELDMQLAPALDRYQEVLLEMESAFDSALPHLEELEAEYINILRDVEILKNKRDVVISNIVSMDSSFRDSSEMQAILKELQSYIETKTEEAYIAVSYEDIGEVSGIMHPLFNFLHLLSKPSENVAHFRAAEGTMVSAPFNSEVIAVGTDYITFDVGVGIKVYYTGLKEVTAKEGEKVYQYQVVGYSDQEGMSMRLTINEEEVNVHKLGMKSRIPVSMAGG